MKHTPGPWTVGTSRALAYDSRGDVCDERIYISPDPKISANMICQVGGLRDRNTEANARLISAAPELLEACKAALKIIEAEQEACGIYTAHTNIIRAAIAKAEGRDDDEQTKYQN